MTRKLLLASTLVLSFTGVSAVAKKEAAKAPEKYSAGSYQIDAAHSKVGFEIPHLVISTVEGKFTKFDGTLELAEKFDQSKVNMTVDMTSIDTAQPKRDEHLKSPDFFDIAKHPTMKFESLSLKGKPESFKLTGNLTIKGVTKKVDFDAKYLGTVVDGYGNQKAAFTAKAKISRKEFGLTWNNVVEAGPVVGDQVTLDLRLQAGRPAKQLASDTPAQAPAQAPAAKK